MTIDLSSRPYFVAWLLNSQSWDKRRSTAGGNAAVAVAADRARRVVINSNSAFASIFRRDDAQHQPPRYYDGRAGALIQRPKFSRLWGRGRHILTAPAGPVAGNNNSRLSSEYKMESVVVTTFPFSKLDEGQEKAPVLFIT